MKQLFITLLLSFICLISFGQSFEGEIVYQTACKSKMPNIPDQQLSLMMGNVQHYYIKGGDYKSETGGTVLQWQLYINAENKVYNKFSKSDTLLWNDAAVNRDSILSIELNPGVTEILGYKCDELVLNCKSGTQRYYFSSKLPVDSKLFANHTFGNWFAYLSKANALPLKMIIDIEQFTMISVATEIKPMKLDKGFFTLPVGVKTMKSPY